MWRHTQYITSYSLFSLIYIYINRVCKNITQRTDFYFKHLISNAISLTSFWADDFDYSTNVSLDIGIREINGFPAIRTH